ncbi:tetratricopeptide repeat protein [Kutzneria viridogrisea]|uniref:Tetratricopeptide (TPR) repeat protein n=1 Tax=Kutzneria viridogrisea TaxID=47990 RepID=A0ABR6BTV8_9PSEU|nr:tetratricopeptide (TPR) repeat protein [Kutzneria viridogrisea]
MGDRGDGGGSAFGAELERMLVDRRISWRTLADLVGYTPSWLSKVKNGTPPSAELARRCDQVLEAGGTLISLANNEIAARPAQLPAAAARFVGREEHLAVLRATLTGDHQRGTPAVVAVDGAPGTGKTTLALRLAHDVAPRFPDGQLYVDLQGYSPVELPLRPTDVLEEFLSALGVSGNAIPAEQEQRAKMFRSLVARGRVLIVLDNAAESQQLEPLLPGSGDCAVVVTSRRRLSGMAMRTNAKQLTLGPMTETEATTLLSRVIGEQRTATEPAAITALAQRCAHLPLALRIAAERVATHPHRSVDELVEELDADDQRLDGLATDDSIAVRAVFSWSYRDLSGESARMFRLLGLFRGVQISTAAAAALAGVPVHHGRRLLERLASVHLLEGLARDRYRLHDLLRVYAAELAGAEESAPARQEAVRRLTDWYLHTAERANETLAPFRVHTLEVPAAGPTVTPEGFTDPVEALRWCDGELANLVPLIQTAIDHGLLDTAWRVGIAMWDYFSLRTPMGVWVSTHLLAEQAARTAGDLFAQAWVQTNLAAAKHRLHEFDQATELYRSALAIRERIGDEHGQAWTLAGLGFLHLDQGLAEEAEQVAGRALARFRELGDRHGEVVTMSTLGEVLRLRGLTQQALDALTEALRVADECEDPSAQADALGKMAEAHLALGDREQALDCLNRALAIARDGQNRWGEADILSRRGAVLRGLGRVGDARRSWEAALRLYSEVDDRRATDVRAQLETLS